MRARLVVCLAVLALWGCAQPKVPIDRFYRLDVRGLEPGTGPALAGTLVVDRFVAAGLLGERAVAYASGGVPEALQQYRYEFWAQPPPGMLQDLAVDVLRAAHAAERVVTPELRARADWELRGKVRRLEHLPGPTPRVAVALEFALTRAADGELVWIGVYAAERAAPDATMAGAMRAMSEALTEVFGRMLRELPR